MANNTIEDVLKDDVREQWLIGQVQSLRHSGFSETKASQIAVEQWEELKIKVASLQTPSNEKYGWVDVGVPPKKEGEYYLNVFSHRLGKDVRRIGHYQNGKWHIENKVGPEDVIEWLDESTPIPLTPCVELEKEVERLKGLIESYYIAYECQKHLRLDIKLTDIELEEMWGKFKTENTL